MKHYDYDSFYLSSLAFVLLFWRYKPCLLLSNLMKGHLPAPFGPVCGKNSTWTVGLLPGEKYSTSFKTPVINESPLKESQVLMQICLLYKQTNESSGQILLSVVGESGTPAGIISLLLILKICWIWIMTACPSTHSVHAGTQQARLHFLMLYPHKNVHPCCGFTAAPGWFIWAVNESTFSLRWWIICFDVSISLRQKHYNNTPPGCASHALLDLRKNKWCWFAARCCRQQPSRDKIWLERGMLSYLVGLPAASELCQRFKEII